VKDIELSVMQLLSIRVYNWKKNYKKKNKTIFIHSTWYSTSFDIAKNINDELVNKLTTSKLISYSDKMSANNKIKLKW